MHDDAENDIRELAMVAPGAARYITAVLEQVAADPDLADRLSQEGYGNQGVDPFNVDAVDSHQVAGRNVWRLKTWTDDGREIFYRVIYAFDTQTHDYTVLGVLRRDIAYKPGHPRVQRLVAAYESLELGPG